MDQNKERVIWWWHQKTCLYWWRNSVQPNFYCYENKTNHHKEEWIRLTVTNCLLSGCTHWFIIAFVCKFTIRFTSKLDVTPRHSPTGYGFLRWIWHVVANRAGIRGCMLVCCTREHGGVCVRHHWYGAAVCNTTRVKISLHNFNIFGGKSSETALSNIPCKHALSKHIV